MVINNVYSLGGRFCVMVVAVVMVVVVVVVRFPNLELIIELPASITFN